MYKYYMLCYVTWTTISCNFFCEHDYITEVGRGSDSDNNIGVLIGAAVGGVCGAIVVVVVIVMAIYCCCCRKDKRKS